MAEPTQVTDIIVLAVILAVVVLLLILRRYAAKWRDYWNWLS